MPKKNLPKLTPEQQVVVSRMAKKTGLPRAGLELDLRGLLRKAGLVTARSAKEKALEQHDYQAYRAWTIKEARFAAGLTQEELAKKIGAQQPAIARLEDPKYEAQAPETLIAIAKALGLKYQPPMLVSENA